MANLDRREQGKIRIFRLSNTLKLLDIPSCFFLYRSPPLIIKGICERSQQPT